jgi:drug/metabolite transporter (DMT)-like permease
VTLAQGLELLAAAALFAAGVWLYRRRSGEERYGSQSAVLLFVAAALLAVHGLGLMHYRPSASEVEAFGGSGS